MMFIIVVKPTTRYQQNNLSWIIHNKMPMYFIITAISGSYPDITVSLDKKYLKNHFFIGIFYPLGELISLHRRRCSPFAVVHYSFMGHFLAAAAISTRE